VTGPSKPNPIGKRPRPETPKALDRASIEEKALAYLDKFDASQSRLRRVLNDFVQRRATALGADPEPFVAMVTEVVARYEANGLINDRRYGTAMATRLSERGVSSQVIRMKLQGRGLAGELANEVTQALRVQGHSDLDAARALVKKRKLGFRRPESERRSSFRRDLGILARAGFDFDTARQALSVESAEEDEDF
jgi:regulatory protein